MFGEYNAFILARSERAASGVSGYPVYRSDPIITGSNSYVGSVVTSSE